MLAIDPVLDEPMFSPRPGSGPGKADTVLYVGETIPWAELLRLGPCGRARVEPDLARAIALCLAGRESRLVVDLSHLGVAALSAVCHLRLLRPGLEIILLMAEEDSLHLRGTLLDGLAVISVCRASPPPVVPGRSF